MYNYYTPPPNNGHFHVLSSRLRKNLHSSIIFNGRHTLHFTPSKTLKSPHRSAARFHGSLYGSDSWVFPWTPKKTGEQNTPGPKRTPLLPKKMSSNQSTTKNSGRYGPSFFGHEVDQTFNAPLLALAILVVFTVHRTHLDQRTCLGQETVIPVDQIEIL